MTSRKGRKTTAKTLKLDMTDERIMAGYLQGRTQRELADDPDIPLKSQAAISYRLSKIRDYWRQSAIYDMNEMMGRELARMDLIESEAWRAWYQSWLDAEVHIDTRSQTQPYHVLDDDGNPVVDQDDGRIVIHPGQIRSDRRDEVRGRLPDPRYLQVVAWAVEQRRKIFGLANMDVNSGSLGEPFQIEVFHRLVQKAERGELYALPTGKMTGSDG